MPLPPAPTWAPEFPRRSPMFAPLRALAEKLPELGWPNAEILNYVAQDGGRRIVNARGQRIEFVTAGPPGGVRESSFEARIHATGQVPVRPVNWHDLLNALVWMVFPTAKAAVNGRHALEMEAQPEGPRTPVRDALTHFDEDGVIVLTADPALAQLLREFAWKELFWRRREAVRYAMRFLVFGHALYEKALTPFVGMTGKALIFEVDGAVLAREPARLLAEADRLTGLYALNPARMLGPAELAPLPVLGVPGWWPDNETHTFYDNDDYFRPGRRRYTNGSG
jgi:hypothetical protein